MYGSSVAVFQTAGRTSKQTHPYQRLVQTILRPNACYSKRPGNLPNLITHGRLEYSLTYENDFTVSNCYDHHNDVSWRVGLGRDAGRDDFPFYITSHHITMNPQGDHIPTPRSDRNPFVHLRNSNKGKKSSIACGARAKRKSSVATFPDFTLLGVFLQSGSSVPVFSLFKGVFC